MDLRVKALVVLLPFIIAAYVGFSMLQPALQDVSTKDSSIGEKNTENENLETKLAGAGKVKIRQQQLSAEIEKLRSSVPKSPDIDLLTIDLEKMCKDAGMNMVALLPSKEVPGTPKTDDEKTAALKKKQDKLKNILKGGADGSGTSAKEEDEPQNELATSSKQFIVTGDYDGLEKLVHEMETYQRVLKINDIAFRVPKSTTAKEKVKIDDSALSEGDEGGDSRLLFITMTITTYYLP